MKRGGKCVFRILFCWLNKSRESYTRKRRPLIRRKPRCVDVGVLFASSADPSRGCESTDCDEVELAWTLVQSAL